MGPQVKVTSKVSERNTKNDILEAYQDLLAQVNVDETHDETSQQEKTIVDSAALRKLLKK